MGGLPLTHVPEHLVVQHVLGHVHDDLPIDTRLHFGMKPRKIRMDPVVRQLLSDCIAERTMYIDEEPDLAVDVINRVLDPGVCSLSGKAYDAVEIKIRIYWFPEDSTMSTTFSKTYVVVGETPYSGRIVTEHLRVNDSHTGRLYVCEVSGWKDLGSGRYELTPYSERHELLNG